MIDHFLIFVCRSQLTGGYELNLEPLIVGSDLVPLGGPLAL